MSSGGLGSAKPALLSSNEYSMTSEMSSLMRVVRSMGRGGAGVMAVCIGTDTVEGVDGTGIGIIFGVLISSSDIEIVFIGVLDGRFTFCNFSLRSFNEFDEFIELEKSAPAIGTGAKGFRTTIGDSASLASTLDECFFTGRPGTSKPLLPLKHMGIQPFREKMLSSLDNNKPYFLSTRTELARSLSVKSHTS